MGLDKSALNPNHFIAFHKNLSLIENTFLLEVKMSFTKVN